MTYLKVRQNGDLLKDTFVPKSFVNILDTFLEDSWNAVKPSGRFPAVDIIERENDFEIQLQIPGYTKENISITEEDNRLTISGEKKAEELKENEKYHLKETSGSKFERSFNLPENINKDNIKAEFKNGILHVVIEKVVPQKNTRSIEIS